MSKTVTVDGRTFVIPDEPPEPTGDPEHDLTWTGNAPWQIVMRKAAGVKEIA